MKLSLSLVLFFTTLFAVGCAAEVPLELPEETSSTEQALVDWCGPDAPEGSPPCWVAPPGDSGYHDDGGGYSVHGPYRRQDCPISGPPSCFACDQHVPGYRSFQTCCDPCGKCYTREC